MVPSTVGETRERNCSPTHSGTSSRVRKPVFAVSGYRKSRASKRKTGGPSPPSFATRGSPPARGAGFAASVDFWDVSSDIAFAPTDRLIH